MKIRSHVQQHKMIALKYSDIPAYLYDSLLYQSLDSEDESDVIELPELFYKATDSVEDVAELNHMLHVIKYWGLTSLSLGPIKFCFENLDVAWPVVRAFENAHPDFATLFQRGDVNKALTEAIKANKKDEIVHYLAKMSNPHLRGNQAMEAAASVGRLDFIEMIHKLGFVWNSNAIIAATRAGHLDCLKYLCENIPGYLSEANLVEAAAANGHVECLRYLHTKFASNLSERIFNPEIMASAALGGHLDCLTFMCELNYKHNWFVTANAAMGGHLNCLKFLRSIGCEWDNVTMANAAEKGHLSCLMYAVENGCPRVPAAMWPDAMDLAIKNGHNECVQYLHSQDFLPSPFNITDAAKRGDIERIKRLRELGCPWPKNHALYMAIKEGHLDCLQYLVESGVPWDEQAIAEALYCNDQTAERLACAMYAVADGCPLPSRVGKDELCTALIKHPGFTVSHLKRLREANCPWSAETMRAAAMKGYFDCVQYLVDNGCPFPEWKNGKYAYMRAMKVSNATPDGIKCLHLAKCPWDGLLAKDARTLALRQDLLDCGCPEYE